MGGDCCQRLKAVCRFENNEESNNVAERREGTDRKREDPRNPLSPVKPPERLIESLEPNMLLLANDFRFSNPFCWESERERAPDPAGSLRKGLKANKAEDLRAMDGAGALAIEAN